MHTRNLILVTCFLVVIAGCEQQPPGGTSPTTQPTTGAVTLEDVQRSAGEAAGKAYAYVREKTAEYRRRLEPTLDAAEAEIQKLRNRLSEAAEEARPEIERRIEDLREKAAAAREKFERVQDASGAAWEEARGGMEAALEELRAALEEGTPQAPGTQPVDQAEP